jgi:hypothetical protein
MSVLVRTFEECKSESGKLFTQLSSKLIEKLELTPPIPPTDLSPPHEVHEVASSLNEVGAIFDASLVPESDRLTEFEPVLLSLVQPMLQILEQCSVTLEPLKKSVFQLNSASVLHSAVSSRGSYAPKAVTALNDFISKNRVLVTDKQASGLFARVGLAETLELLDLVKKSQSISSSFSSFPSSISPLISMPGFDDVSRLNASLRAFDAALLELGAVELPLLDKMVDVSLRRSIRVEVASVVAERYGVLFDAITDEKHSGFSNPQTLFRFKPHQIASLFSS